MSGLRSGFPLRATHPSVSSSKKEKKKPGKEQATSTNLLTFYIVNRSISPFHLRFYLPLFPSVSVRKPNVFFNQLPRYDWLLKSPLMALFGSASSQAASLQSQQIKAQLQDQISQELAVANATELVNKITQNCFDKCIFQPQDSITPQQDGCINQCLEKYMRSWNVISKTYISRIQSEKSA